VMSVYFEGNGVNSPRPYGCEAGAAPLLLFITAVRTRKLFAWGEGG
jgi:hypothetical protein